MLSHFFIQASKLTDRIIWRIVRELKSFCYKRPTSGTGRIVCISRGVKLRLSIAPSARIVLNGDLKLQSALGDRGDVSISLGENSVLRIDGEFTVGAGVRLFLSANAQLIIGGKKDSSGSGITSNSRIMVRDRVTIGADTIIAWDCFITDCDWHQILGQTATRPVVIGEKVWIACGAKILKGSELGDGSIVGAGTIVAGGMYATNSLIAGNPARVVRENVQWERDLEIPSK